MMRAFRALSHRRRVTLSSVFILLRPSKLLDLVNPCFSNASTFRFNDIDSKAKMSGRGGSDDFAVEAFSKKSIGGGRMIYSGRKKTGVTKMMSLFDMCMMILGNHIEDLEEVGGEGGGGE